MNNNSRIESRERMIDTILFVVQKRTIYVNIIAENEYNKNVNGE